MSARNPEKTGNSHHEKVIAVNHITRMGLLLLLVALVATPAFAGEDVLLGRVSLVAGKAQCKSPTADAFEPVKLGAEVRNGTLLQVAPEGRVEVCYADGAVIRFAGGSKVQFQLSALRLFDGKVWLRVVKKGEKFEVVTPTFVAGVRGTVFSVEARRKGKGAVRVTEGVVYSTTKQGSVDVAAGQRVEIEPTGYMTKPAAVAGAESDFAEAAWQADDRKTAYRRYLMLLFKGIEPEDVASGEAEAAIQARKQLPEIKHAYWTYEGYANQ